MLRLFMMCFTPVSLSETSYFWTSNSAIVCKGMSACLYSLTLAHWANQESIMSIFSGKVGVRLFFECDSLASEL